MRKILAKAAPWPSSLFVRKFKATPHNTHTAPGQFLFIYTSYFEVHFRSRGSPSPAFPQEAEGSLRPLLCGLVHSRAQRMVSGAGQALHTPRSPSLASRVGANSGPFRG